MTIRRRDLMVPSATKPLINDKLGVLTEIVQRLSDQGELDADAISGVLAEDIGGTGESTYADGQLLIGNGTTKGLDKATLTAGSNVTITNGAGSIQIAAAAGGGIGNVTGPASATANDIVVFDGTTGKLIRDGGKGLPAGAIVGTTDSQTLTNKTLTTPTIGDFSNATHGHQNAAGGGTLDVAALASGQLALARGGTGADLSATGGTSQVLRQSTLGGAVTVSQLAFSNISGSVAATQLPNPSATTLGGIESIAAVSHQWIDSISTSGVPHLSQPAAADVSGLAASATTDTTNASNISSGTLGAARLPNPSATTLGGIESIAASSNQWIDSISTSGVPHQSQPGFSNLSGSVAASQMPALTGDVTTSAGAVATTIGAGKVTLAMQANMATSSLVYRKTAGSGAPEVNTLATLKTDLGLTGTNSGDQVVPANTTSTASNYFTAYNSTTGAFTKAQPAFTDISGSVAAAQMPALTGDVTTSAGTVATAIGSGKVTNTMLAGSIAASKLVGTDIATVGTITAGTWTGTTIAVANGGTGLTSTAWQTRTFSAGNFTANGSMTWTVDSGDVTTDAYLQIGKSVWYSFYLVTTTIGGTPNTTLQIKLPNSITANRTMVGSVRVDNNGAVAMSWCRVQAAATNLEIFLNAAAGNYATNTNGTTVTGQIFFEAQ